MSDFVSFSVLFRIHFFSTVGSEFCHSQSMFADLLKCTCILIFFIILRWWMDTISLRCRSFADMLTSWQTHKLACYHADTLLFADILPCCWLLARRCLLTVCHSVGWWHAAVCWHTDMLLVAGTLLFADMLPFCWLDTISLRFRSFADMLLPDLNRFAAPLLYDDLRREIKVSILDEI